jgi:hypothetical protein
VPLVPEQSNPFAGEPKGGPGRDLLGNSALDGKRSLP